VKWSSPSFEITVRMRSPGFSQTCLSLGMPTITPLGVPVKNTSPGCSVMYCDV